MADDGDTQAGLLEERRDRAARLALAATRPHGADGDDVPAAGEHRQARRVEDELRAAGQGPAGGVHDLLMADVAVAEGHPIRLEVPDDRLELLLGDDRDPFRIARPGELGRIAAARDARDLGGGERDDGALVVLTIEDVEIVEVPAGGPHHHDPPNSHLTPPVATARGETFP